ncbi:MAG: hypothetical protein ABDH37_08590 [Candidatus Hydrothermales bacterium]
MIKNKKILEEFEKNLIKNTPSDFEKNFKIFEEMRELAFNLGKLPPNNLLEGIEIDIKYASVINGIKRIN